MKDNGVECLKWTGRKKSGKCHLTMDGSVGKFYRVAQRVRHVDNVIASYFFLYFFPQQGKCVGP